MDVERVRRFVEKAVRDMEGEYGEGVMFDIDSTLSYRQEADAILAGLPDTQAVNHEEGTR